MHWFPKLLMYFLVLGVIPLMENYIPKEDAAFRTLLAFTWLLWVCFGLALAVRGTYRFITR